MTKEFDARNEEKSRSVCAAMADAADTGKRALSERERQILDMWPRFEDGEYAWFGDKVYGLRGGINNIDIYECTTNLYDVDINHIMTFGERVKRPEVLDADGVPIREGDTVWIIPECIDTPDEPHKVRSINRWGEVLLEFHTEGSTGVKGEYLTHVQPDSWQRLEEAAREFARDNQLPHDVDQMERDAVDLIRRAKKLAGIEVE